jgi:hypothetical protein
MRIGSPRRMPAGFFQRPAGNMDEGAASLSGGFQANVHTPITFVLFFNNFD